MPTELPDLTSEFIGRYNQQQRELQSRYPTETVPAEPENGELQRLRAELQKQQADRNVLDAEVAELRKELANSRNAIRAEEEKARLAAEDAAAAQLKLKELLKEVKDLRKKVEEPRLAGPKPPDRRELADLKAKLKTLEGEIQESQKTIDNQKRTIVDLKQKLVSKGSESEPPVSPVELIRKLNEVRQKLRKCSQRVDRMREFEFSIDSQLTTEQRRVLVDALNKELAGKTERYQALSLWENAGDPEGA